MSERPRSLTRSTDLKGYHQPSGKEPVHFTNMFMHSNLKIKREQTALKNEREKGSLKPSLHLALTSVDWRDEAQMFPWAMATWKLLIRPQVR